MQADALGTVAFAFGAGVATFFSPCAYPLLPGYVGFYASRSGEGDAAPLGGAVLRGAAATAGLLAVFGLLLAVVAVVGSSGIAGIAVVEPIVGLGLVGLGALTLADRVPEPSVALPARRTTVLGFAAFGAVYAVAAAGCVLPVLAAVVLQALTLTPSGAAAAVGAYAIGAGILMAAVTVVAAVGVDVGTGLARYVGSVVRLSGALMILAGLGQLYLSIVVLGVL